MILSIQRHPALALPFPLVIILALLAVSFGPPNVFGQVVTTSPPPAQVLIVTNAYAWSLAKHPTLPVLYLTGYGSPDSKNLITVGLSGDGSLADDNQRTWPDYFTTNPTNENFRYYVSRPVVSTEGKILYLAACPFYVTPYYAETNNHEVAVIGLDEQGLPTKLLTGFRTTHTEKGITSAGWDPIARRLFLSYNTYMGWCGMDKTGLPVSNQFHLLLYLGNFWHYKHVLEWQQLYGFQQNFGLGIARLSADGTSVEFLQYTPDSQGSSGNIDVSRKFHKVYLLDGPDYRKVRICQLNREGHLTGVPRFFALGDRSSLIRFDFKADLLYALNESGVLKIYHLNARGYPAGTPQLSQLPCSGVRDAVVDEVTGKVYVAATTPAK